MVSVVPAVTDLVVDTASVAPVVAHVVAHVVAYVVVPVAALVGASVASYDPPAFGLMSNQNPIPLLDLQGHEWTLEAVCYTAY